MSQPHSFRLVAPASGPASDRRGLRRYGDALVMFLVTGLSLALLIYVGVGEAKQTYGEFYVSKMAASAGVARNSMEAFLRHGLPLRQYVGFHPLTDPMVETEDVAAVMAFDPAGREVFRNVNKRVTTVPHPPGLNRPIDETAVHRTADYYQIILPLHNRFEVVGSLVVSTTIATVTQRVERSFELLPLFAGLLAAAFAAFVAFAGPRLVGARLPWLQIGYAVIFLAMASIVIATLVSLYSDGVQGRARVLADTLGQRLSEVIKFNLSLNDLHGLDRVFADYQRANQDISGAGLIVDGKVRIYTTADRVGKPWKTDPRSYEYMSALGQANQERLLQIAVEMPRELVFREVFRSVKDFAALFLASAFLAGLFLQVATSLQRSTQLPPQDDPLQAGSSREEIALSIMKPLFFVAVFVEHMTYSFLPQHMQKLATESGLSAGIAFAPFMAYYLAFALSLVPSGHIARQLGPRRLMLAGLVLAGAGLMALALPIDFWGAFAARAVAGIGQGMLFIGVQSYILVVARPDRRTQSNAIIVFGFQGGMISGMAIGSLLVVYTGPSAVFTLGSVLAWTVAFYGLWAIPAYRRPNAAGERLMTSIWRLWADVGQVLRDGRFMQTMLLIGIPAKAALTGVITFALPLLLAQKEYKQEDIGQIIMLYAIGVIVASHYVSRLVDRTARTTYVLVLGSVVAGAGMLTIALTGSQIAIEGISANLAATLLTVVGVMVVGIAHGFVNAPVVTHIAELELAKRIGVDATMATYRFLERIGHIAGPIVIGQLMLFFDAKLSVLTVCGIGTIVLGLAFLAWSENDGNAGQTLEKAA